MGRIISGIRRLVAWPVRLPWMGYKGLWWAFGDEAQPENAQASAEPAPKPVEKTLKFGYGATLAASAMVAIVSTALVDDGRFSPATGWSVWGWATGLAAVISIWGVRHISRQQALRNAAGWKGHAQAAGAGFREMGRDVAGVAVRARDVTVNAGKHAAVAGKHVANGARVTADCCRRVKGWVRPGIG